MNVFSFFISTAKAAWKALGVVWRPGGGSVCSGIRQLNIAGRKNQEKSAMLHMGLTKEEKGEEREEGVEGVRLCVCVLWFTQTPVLGSPSKCRHPAGYAGLK